MDNDIEIDGATWHVGGLLGEGGFARVYEAVGEDGTAAVVKLVRHVPGVDREAKFANPPGVPNVIPILAVHRADEHHVIVMPRADCSLREYIVANGHKLTVDETVTVLTDLLNCLSSLGTSIVHRDIKPENVLLYGGRWRLADFGIARYVDASTALYTFKNRGTAPYAAPEQWREERASPATDMYAVGVMAYEMLVGRRPFDGPTAPEFKQQHLESVPAKLDDIPVPLWSLIESCLLKAPGARPTATSALKQLTNAAGAIERQPSKLQLANAAEVRRLSSVQADAEALRTEKERRDELFRVAIATYESLFARLEEAVSIEAQAAGPGFPFALGHARLSLSPKARQVPLANQGGERAMFSPPFSVVAEAVISVAMPAKEYEGRAHSLWYADAKQEGVFRWYETAFMVHPLSNRRPTTNPFALSAESREAAEALAPGIGSTELAWPFMPIDQGDDEEFVTRWLDWFGLAAIGELHQPRKLPEGDPRGSYRRE